MSAVLLFAIALASVPGGTCAEPANVATDVAYAAGDVVSISSARGSVRAADAESGEELWVYELPDLLPGDVRAMRFDGNGDGRIDPRSGDKAWVFFGTRNSSFYFALDVTDRERPTLLWKLGPDDLPGIGETWSAPTLARVLVQGAEQNGERLVAVFGGGSNGGVFMVDARTGRLLWSAEQNPSLDATRYAMPSRVTAVDTNGDALADRLYVGDLGGQLWRFDVWNGRPPSELVTGGVLASLGAADPEAVLPGDARQFFNAPDVAPMPGYYNIALGSGDRTRLFESQTRDRIYSVRDRLEAGEVGTTAPIRDRDLVDITALTHSSVPDSAPGWKLELRPGESALTEALTADGTILLTTFESAGECGVNRVYALRVESGQAALDLNGDEEVTAADTSMTLAQPGIAGEVEMKLGVREPVLEGEPRTQGHWQCQVGGELLPECPDMSGIKRTFWYRRGAD